MSAYRTVPQQMILRLSACLRDSAAPRLCGEYEYLNSSPGPSFVWSREYGLGRISPFPPDQADHLPRSQTYQKATVTYSVLLGTELKIRPHPNL